MLKPTALWFNSPPAFIVLYLPYNIKHYFTYLQLMLKNLHDDEIDDDHDHLCKSPHVLSYHCLQIPVVCMQRWHRWLTTTHHRWFPRPHCNKTPLVPHTCWFHSPAWCHHSGRTLTRNKQTNKQTKKFQNEYLVCYVCILCVTGLWLNYRVLECYNYSAAACAVQMTRC